MTTPALSNLALKKHDRPQFLPLTNDLLVLRNYLMQEIKTVITKVKINPNKENWKQLAQVSLARMIMFNKRRGDRYIDIDISQGHVLHHGQVFF